MKVNVIGHDACKKCGNDTWTLSMKTTIKRYTPLRKGEKPKWVENERKDDNILVECAKCGCSEAKETRLILKKTRNEITVIFESTKADEFFEL